ncbi:MAG: AraC family transcriptional regulator ligand-binding domain-containing protein [Proteobacteria bacterium]|nr:AraC family transcriptional regulator ligand-binding domain-containing protein [Pseudomonadota bacterium]
MSDGADGQQRVGPFHPLPALLHELGADPSAVLQAAGLPPDALDDPDGSISFVAAAAVMEAAALATRRPDIALMLGARLTTRLLGPIGALMRSAPDLGTALNDLVAHQHRNARGAVVYLAAHPDAVLIGYAVYQPDVPALDLLGEVAVAAGARILQELGAAPPRAVLLAHGPRADARTYARYLGPQIRFEAEQNALLIPQPALATPLATADPLARALHTQEVSEYWAVAQPGLSERVLRLLRPLVVLRTPDVEEIAALVGIRPRTLNRLLRAEGTNYRQLLTEARLETARQLLRRTRMPVTQIAVSLGYAQHSDFTRAFRRGAGVAPRAFRERGPHP